MEGFSKAIQQPEYVHVLLNHFPITGLFVALVFLVVAIVINQRSLQLTSLVAVAVLSLSAWPVAHYGEEAYDRVLSMTDDEGGQYLKRHEELADHWIFLFYVTAGTAVVTLIAGAKKQKILRWGSCGVAAFAIASLIAGAVIADCGGKIRHREFRYGPPPTVHEDSAAPD